MPVAPVITNYNDIADRSIYEAVWTLTTANPIGIAVNVPAWPDKTWHATGTIGSPAAILQVQASALDVEADYAVAHDGGGVDITITALPQVALQLENTVFIRPKLTTVGTGATVVVTLMALRPTRMRA